MFAPTLRFWWFGPSDRSRTVRRFGERRPGENVQRAFPKNRGPRSSTGKLAKPPGLRAQKTVGENVRAWATGGGRGTEIQHSLRGLPEFRHSACRELGCEHRTYSMLSSLGRSFRATDTPRWLLITTQEDDGGCNGRYRNDHVHCRDYQCYRCLSVCFTRGARSRPYCILGRALGCSLFGLGSCPAGCVEALNI